MDDNTMQRTKIRPNPKKMIALFLILAIAGCALYRNQKAVEMKVLLETSGFKLRLADTKTKLAQLQELPQRKLVAQTWGGKVRYVYADAQTCKCAYVGDEAAYNRFQDLALQRKIAAEDRLAAERDRPADLDWGGWRFDESW